MIVRRTLGVAGVGAGLFSVACMIAVLGFLTGASPSDNAPAANLAALVFFLGTTVGSVFLARWGFSNPGPAPGEPDAHSTQVRQVLKVAQAAGGELTLMQVVAETTLSIEQCRGLLESMVSEGLAQMRVDDEGVILYSFPDFQYAPGRSLPERGFSD